MEKSLRKQTSVFDKGQVLGLHCAGKSTKETSEMTAIGVRTVQKTIAQWKKTGKCSHSAVIVAEPKFGKLAIGVP